MYTFVLHKAIRRSCIFLELIFLKSILNFILKYKIFNILIFSLLKLLKYTVSWKVDARLQKFMAHIKKNKKITKYKKFKHH